MTVRRFKVSEQILERRGLSLLLPIYCNVDSLMVNSCRPTYFWSIGLLGYRALHVGLLLVVVLFKIRGQPTDDLIIDLWVLLERIAFEVENSESLEVFQHLDKVDDSLVCEIDLVILESHLHNIAAIFLSV